MASRRLTGLLYPSFHDPTSPTRCCNYKSRRRRFVDNFLIPKTHSRCLYKVSLDTMSFKDLSPWGHDVGGGGERVGVYWSRLYSWTESLLLRTNGDWILNHWDEIFDSTRLDRKRELLNCPCQRVITTCDLNYSPVYRYNLVCLFRSLIYLSLSPSPSFSFPLSSSSPKSTFIVVCLLSETPEIFFLLHRDQRSYDQDPKDSRLTWWKLIGALTDTIWRYEGGGKLNFIENT